MSKMNGFLNLLCTEIHISSQKIKYIKGSPSNEKKNSWPHYLEEWGLVRFFFFQLKMLFKGGGRLDYLNFLRWRTMYKDIGNWYILKQTFWVFFFTECLYMDKKNLMLKFKADRMVNLLTIRPPKYS